MPGLDEPGKEEPWNQHTSPSRAIAGRPTLRSELLVPKRDRDHLTPAREHAQTEEASSFAGLAGILTLNPHFERNLPEEFPHDMG